MNKKDRNNCPSGRGEQPGCYLKNQIGADFTDKLALLQAAPSTAVKRWLRGRNRTLVNRFENMTDRIRATRTYGWVLVLMDISDVITLLTGK